MKKLYQKIASLVIARSNCAEAQTRLNPNAVSASVSMHENEWHQRQQGINNHTATIEKLIKQFLPSGSGWDCGTKLDFDSSHGNKLVFYGSFHHMNDVGYYDGWTDHSIIVTPSLAYGLNIRVTGRNRNDIKDYIAEMFESDLNQDITDYLDRARITMQAEKHVEWFKAHCGFSYDPKTETADQGKQRCAESLAYAEQYAKFHNFTFEWSEDWETGSHVKEFGPPAYTEEPKTCEQCICKDETGKVIASLHCIDDADSDYRRLIQAELADEAIAEMQKAGK